MMMHKYILFLLTAFFVFISHKTAFAITDPRDYPNNKFGIHIMNEDDLADARTLVNSSGGEWGYVTIVIRKDERNINRWQRVFDDMRRKRLIPIVRIATRQTPEGWEKLKREDIQNWVYFLNSLNWVVENRYVIVGNEPNHATEWAGEVNPEEYSDYLLEFSSSLKSASNDFFIIPAGFDASAPNASGYLSEDDYLKRMLEKNPSLFDHIDGWASHSYPNPGFSGSVSDSGRGSIKTYEWELNYLKSLGVSKDLPVFITETGWAHNMNSSLSGLLHPQFVGVNLVQAYEQVWQDDRIVAITPFVLNYHESPFDIFSWKNKNGEFYDFYYEVQKISKTAGKPNQRSAASINSVNLPDKYSGNNEIAGYTVVENIGQDIWEPETIFLINDFDNNFEFNSYTNSTEVAPGKKTILFFVIKPHRLTSGDMHLSLKVVSGTRVLSQGYRTNITQQLSNTLSLTEKQEKRPKFESVRTVLPIVFISKHDNDIFTSI